MFSSQTWRIFLFGTACEKQQKNPLTKSNYIQQENFFIISNKERIESALRWNNNTKKRI